MQVPSNTEGAHTQTNIQAPRLLTTSLEHPHSNLGPPNNIRPPTLNSPLMGSTPTPLTNIRVVAPQIILWDPPPIRIRLHTHQTTTTIQTSITTNIMTTRKGEATLAGHMTDLGHTHHTSAPTITREGRRDSTSLSHVTTAIAPSPLPAV
jgi:hypothetical protein